MRYTFTSSEQEELRKCPHVRSVSARAVQFVPSFKKSALEEYDQGRSAERFFRESGVPTHLFKKDYPRKKIKEWRAIARLHGKSRFDSENRGKVGVASLAKWREKEKAYQAMTDKEKVAFLEAKVESLEHIQVRFQLPPSPHKAAHNSRRRTNAAS